MTDLVKQEPHAISTIGAHALTAPTDWRKAYTTEAIAIIRDTKCRGASDAEFAGMMMFAHMRGLNPLSGQIHFVKRKTKVDGKDVESWVPQVGIDGFRVQACRTKEYDGQDEPEFMTEEVEELAINGTPTGRKVKNIVGARVRVYRKGISRPFVGVAYYDEYVQTYWDAKKSQRVPNSMWATKPRVMLAKCAEALGLRKGFPEEFGDMYIPEEFAPDNDQQSNAERFSAPAPTKQLTTDREEGPTECDVLGDKIDACETQQQLDAVAALSAKAKLTRKERDWLGEKWKAKKALLGEKKPADKPAAKKPDETPAPAAAPTVDNTEPVPCRGCDRTDGTHQDGCPEVTPPPAVEAAK